MVGPVSVYHDSVRQHVFDPKELVKRSVGGQARTYVDLLEVDTGVPSAVDDRVGWRKRAMEGERGRVVGVVGGGGGGGGGVGGSTVVDLIVVVCLICELYLRVAVRKIVEADRHQRYTLFLGLKAA